MFSKKLEHLHKPETDLTKYDNEACMKNPLLDFHLSDVRRRRHYDYLKQKAAQEKIKLARKPAVYLEPIRPEKESYYIDQIRGHVKKITVPKMLPSMENKIKCCTQDLQAKYPDAVNSYMDDLHEDFERRMKDFSMKRILVDPEFEDENPEEFNVNKRDLCKYLQGSSNCEKEFYKNLFETCTRRNCNAQRRKVQK